MTKQIALVVIFGVFLNLSAGASMVSFFVIETGISENEGRNEHSLYWENSFMDIFFDTGHVVSNAPILRLEARPSGDILRAINFDIQSAVEMGIEYLLIAQLDYIEGARQPSEILFFIFKVDTGEKILERRIPGRTYRTTRDEVDGIKTIVRGLVPYISE
ncbi:MAG: hypothetical protein LBI28_02380 [Treponema sp.]|nr:hypothetical protein [Treponema sp.]